MATQDMLTKIEEAMADNILAMKEGSYFFSWGSVNEPDQAKQEFPSAEIMLDNEECLDENGGAWNGAYQNRAYFDITVKARLQNETVSGQQVYAINEELNKALSDLKKCFGIHYDLDLCTVIMYRGTRRVTEPQGDLLVPKRMIVSFSVDYMQGREDPTTGADGA